MNSRFKVGDLLATMPREWPKLHETQKPWTFIGVLKQEDVVIFIHQNQTSIVVLTSRGLCLAFQSYFEKA